MSANLPDLKRRLTLELLVFGFAGIIVGVLGPFGTSTMPTLLRQAYWFICIMGGGVIGIAVDLGLARVIASAMRRVVATSIGMTPLVSFWVIGTNRVLLGDGPGAPTYGRLLWQIFIIALSVMTVRALANRRPALRVETRLIIETPLPEAEATFRRRLSAKRRHASLVAIEANDHYLRVHTDDGAELVPMRLSDAIKELEKVEGFRVHRSWWVAGGAIRLVKWRRGGGEAHLSNDLIVPVSRSAAPRLREAGWR